MSRRAPPLSRNPVYDEPPSAIDVLAEALGVTNAQAREGLRALVKAGYVIGPREPTNAMLLAYVECYGQPPISMETMITDVGKARMRWRAMGDKATAMAMSTRRVGKGDAAPAPKDTGSPGRAKGGRARAERLSPERRSEIARTAARARWDGPAPTR